MLFVVTPVTFVASADSVVQFASTVLCVLVVVDFVVVVLVAVLSFSLRLLLLRLPFFLSFSL